MVYLLSCYSAISFVDFPSLLWYCWLGLLICKNRLPYNLYCVCADVKPCSINQPAELIELLIRDGQMVPVRILCIWLAVADKQTALMLWANQHVPSLTTPTYSTLHTAAMLPACWQHWSYLLGKLPEPMLAIVDHWCNLLFVYTLSIVQKYLPIIPLAHTSVCLICNYSVTVCNDSTYNSHVPASDQVLMVCCLLVVDCWQ